MENKTIAILVGSAVVLTGAGIYGKKVVDQISNDLYYGFNKNSVVPRVISLDRVAFTFDLTIENKGKLDLHGRDLKMKVKSKNVTLTEIKSMVDFNVKPYQTTAVNLEVVLDPRELVSSSPEYKISNWKDIPLTFVGSIKVKRLGIYIPIPFRVTYRLRDFV